MANFWDFLNGRKTYLGAFLAVLYVGATTLGYMQPNAACEYVITAVLGVGLGHKVLKGYGMERIPCPPDKQECKYYPSCFEDIHHLYGKAQAETPLELVFCGLKENLRLNCRDYHEKDERINGWLEYPEVPVMLQALTRAISSGELHLSKRKANKLHKAIRGGNYEAEDFSL